MRLTIRHWLTSAAALTLIGCVAAKAQTPAEEAEAIDLDSVVIRSKTEEGANPAAGTVTTTTTTRTAIDDRSVNDIQDLGRTEEAGISFNRRTSSINIRGLEGPRVLTTVDGVRVPYLSDATRNAVGGADTFDFNSLSALDLTRGSDPLLGSGALGGVLAVRTLDPDDLLAKGRRVGALTKNGYDSTDDSWFTSNAAAMRLGDTSMILQGGYRDGHATDSQGSGDALSTLRTAPNPLDYDSYNLLGKIYQDVEGGHRFGLLGEIFRREEDIDARSTQSESGNYRPGDYATGEETERRKLALSYDLEAPDPSQSLVDDASAVLYYQSVERHTTVDAFRSNTVTGPFTRDNSDEEEAFGFNGFASGGWQMGGLANRLTVGTELRAAQATQYSAGTDACPASGPYPPGFTGCSNLHTNQADTPKVDGRSIGFYAENETGLLGDRLRVTPGLRFDWYEEKPKLTSEFEESAAYDGTLPDASSDTALSPKVLVEYDLVPKLTAYAQWSMGFRAPTVGELYSRFGAVGTYLRIGNADLEAEKSNGFDIGLRAGDEDLGGQVNVFTTRYENFIDTVVVAPPGGDYPQGGISSYENIPKSRISGVELGGHARFLERWRVRASFAYAQGENLTDDTYLDSVPPLTAIVGLGYEREDWGGEVSTKLASRRDHVDEGFEAPGYGVLDFTAWYAPKRVPGLKIAGGIFNILDKTYYDAINVPDARAQPNLYYSEPGRSFKLNATYRF